MSNILLLEDDLSLINGLSFAFKKQGFELNIARTLKEAEELWTDGKYDLLVLDVSLPDGSGFEFCKRVRLTSKVPIIFLTASDEETSIIMGLDIGGDDYITKPFKLGVLVSRINALLRRANSFQAADTELQSNGIKVLLLQGQVFKNGELLDLTAVADAQHRHAPAEDLGVDGGRILQIDAVGAAGEDDALGVLRLDDGQVRLIGIDLTVDIILADAARDELIVLAAKVQHDHGFMLHDVLLSLYHWCASYS